METDGHGLLPEQLEWVEADLASTDKRWKIVAILSAVKRILQNYTGLQPFCSPVLTFRKR